MKKVLTALLALCMLFSVTLCLCACDDEEDVQDAKTTKTATEKKIDLDCTKLSSALAYNKVYQIMCDPQEYAGQRVKIKGTFSKGVISGGGNEHYFIDVYDNTACCSAWLVFIWSGHVYPDEFPASGGDVTVTGKITTFTEGGNVIGQIKAEQVTF